MRKLKNRPTLGKGDDSMNPKRGIRTMHKFLDDLFEKRGSTRETALSSIIEGFTMNYEYQFAKENFATLLYRCLNSVEKGSSKEMGLASNALGLLAITIGCGENAHELYRVVIEPLSQVLKSGPESMISSVLGCLAIVTFVGRSNVVETERTMLIIWRFIHSELCSRVASRKYSVAILFTAISAWSFLLTTMYGWNLNYNHWQGAISFFLNILKANDGSINVVAHESLALIFEVGNLEKFISGTEGTSDCANHKRMNLLHGYSSVLELKEKLIIQVKSLSLQTKGESSATKVMNKKCNYSWDVLEALEDDCFPETLVKIDDQNVRLCTKSQLLQLKFVKNFLGHGFVNHMLVNELLRDVFDFTPKLLSINEPYICERKEVIVRYYDPVIRRKFRLGKNRKEIDKARAILLNKKRDVKAMELRLYDD